MSELSLKRIPRKFTTTGLIIAVWLAIVVPIGGYLYYIKDDPERCGQICHSLTRPKTSAEYLHHMMHALHHMMHTFEMGKEFTEISKERPKKRFPKYRRP